MDLIVDEVDGRRMRAGDRWFIDFASCNYLGFDLEPEIAAAVPAYLARWGTHPSWTRFIAFPRVFAEIETELAELLGTEDSLLFPTITHVHNSVLPALVGQGQAFIDVRSHHTLHDGCAVARGRGATVTRFRNADPVELRKKLEKSTRQPRVVCIDGVNSMTGNLTPIPELAAVAREFEALLYIDDAHGFGVIGERSVTESSPYGSSGNAIVRYVGETYENIVLVGGLSKAYSSMMAFVACPTELKSYLKTAAPTFIFSGPPPVASLATVQAGLRLNQVRGDAIRADLYRKTQRVLTGARALGLPLINTSGTPIIEIPLGSPAVADPVNDHLFERGIFVTPAPYPVVPRDQVGFRLQLTAANTDAEIDHLLTVLAEVAEMAASVWRGN